MNKIAKMFLMVAMLAIASSAVAEGVVGQIYYQEDKSPALTLKNIDPDGSPIKVTIAAGDSATNSVVWQGSTTVTHTLDWSGAGKDTVTELAAQLRDLTNINGKVILAVEDDMSLDADSTDDELLDAQAFTLLSGQKNDIVWDTSVAKFYSTAVLGSDRYFATDVGRKRIVGLYGSVGGTGDITLNVYKNGTEVMEELIESPIGVPNGPTNLVDEVTAAQLSQKYGSFLFGVGAGDDVIVRATRATTATTGGLGVKVESGQ